MTKKEKIIKEWIDLGVKTPLGICDNSGYFHGYFCNGLDEILEGFGLEENQIDYDLDFDGVGKFRPKSLQGIENNNGWINIESEDDLPKESGVYEACINEEYIGRIRFSREFNEWSCIYDSDNLRFPSHYQPIIKPQPPIY